jgi:hypothetical protein
MPRTNSGSELFQYLNTFYKFVIHPTTPGDTTTTSAIVQGDSTVDITATTNFADTDFVMIDGDAGVEITQIDGTPVTTNCPVDRPLLLAQSSGARFVEAQRIDMGHVAEGGIQFGGSQTLTEIKAATSRTAIAFFGESTTLTLTVPLLGYNNLNLLSVFGATESEIGSGTEAAPYAAGVTSDTVGTQGLHCYRAEGQLYDGRIVQVDFTQATVEVNANITIGAPNPDGMTLTAKVTSFLQRIWTP